MNLQPCHLVDAKFRVLASNDVLWRKKHHKVSSFAGTLGQVRAPYYHKRSPTYERERERERLESVCPTDNEEIVLEEDMVMVIVIEGSSEVYGES